MGLKDKLIKENVILHIIGDKNICLNNLNVDVFDGFVKISGTVPDQSSRQRILQKLMEVDGVISVRNRIKIRRTIF